MGWKGTVRTIAATARRMEKEAERNRKIALKEQIAEDASQDVSDWERHIKKLTSLHKNLAAYIDWTAMCKDPQPSHHVPISKTTHQDRAKMELDRFKPKFFDKLRSKTDQKRQVLVDAYQRALNNDRSDHELALVDHEKAGVEWEADRELASRLLAGEEVAIKEVISEFQALSKTDLIGSYISFTIENNFVHAKPQVHSTEIVPDFRRKQLASGKLSQTNMPLGEFNEIYQDYVASVALKVAGDIFQILPLSEVYVTCEAKMLNSATGHQEFAPILSVQFIRKTFVTLNLLNIDTSDSLSNFNHVMNFKKTRGFSPVIPLGD